jgi:hypothetical protein
MSQGTQRQLDVFVRQGVALGEDGEFAPKLGEANIGICLKFGDELFQTGYVQVLKARTIHWDSQIS